MKLVLFNTSGMYSDFAISYNKHEYIYEYFIYNYDLFFSISETKKRVNPSRSTIIGDR